MSLPLTIEFIALLAYPKSQRGQAAAIESMQALWLRECKRAGTLDSLGTIVTSQRMKRQLKKLELHLNKRLVAAHDCVTLDMGLERSHSGTLATLNWIAGERPTQKYKQDWWRPEVMPLAIALRGVLMGWDRQYTEPPSVRTLLLTWPDWFEPAMRTVLGIAQYLATNSATALRGFRRTTFLLPGGQSLRFGNQ